MADTPLTKRLGIKPNYRVLVLRAPEGYVETLEPLPDGATLATAADGSTYDVVQMFVTNRADIVVHAPKAIQALKPGGVLWFTYPKQTSTVKTDIHRDVGWETVQQAGYEPVAMVSVDDTWSAFRFRPRDAIKSRRPK